MQAQLMEAAILNTVNFQTLIATKSSRMVRSAGGVPIMEFGLRRAQDKSAGIYGAKAAVVGGCVGTSNVQAARLFDIPALGTHSHSWIQSFDSEIEAFRAYAKMYPNNTLLLVDTYDVIQSGVPNAIKVAKEVIEPMGKRLKGVRIDSGELALRDKFGKNLPLSIFVRLKR